MSGGFETYARADGMEILFGMERNQGIARALTELNRILTAPGKLLLLTRLTAYRDGV
jgi:hypothetical protein